jgi:hypothetical protein
LSYIHIMKLRNLIILALLSIVPTLSLAETVQIEAQRDATLIEDPDGALANGSGPFFFAGRTAQGQNSVRRALLWFDVVAALPDHAIVESVTLTVLVTQGNPQMREIRLHRVLADWGEGASAASGGNGRPSEPGDATWIHTFHGYDFWTHSGGQFAGRVSARTDVAGSGFYTWESTNHMVQDVRQWNSAPRRNFGWILVGDETEPQTVKRIASRENPDLALRPVLEVTYRAPGRPDARQDSRLSSRTGS